MTRLRVLGALRLSRKTDESTSPERQTSRINWWANGFDGDLIDIAEDLDVSGKVNPFDRDGLGPWLTDPAKIAQWDVLVAWKLDRISRNALDTMQLLKWAHENGKRIVCVDDSLDSGTKMGKMWMQLAAIFAEMELRTIEERTQASREELRQQGRWGGGAPPYGYRAVKKTFADGSSGWKVEPDPETSKVVKRMAQMVIDGDAYRAIARTLNEEDVPRPRNGKRWTSEYIKKVVTNPTVLWGKARHKGVTIEYVEYADPLLTPTEVLNLEKAIEKRAVNRVGRNPKKKLTGVVWCSECGEKAYASANSRGEMFYRCAGRFQFQNGCKNGMISGNWLDAWVEEEFLRIVGNEKMYERKEIPGEDHTAELETIKLRIAKLANMFEMGAFDDADTEFVQSLAALKRKQKELEKLPNRPATVEWVPTGTYYGDVWDSFTPEERRTYMLARGVRVEMRPGKFREVPREQRVQLTIEPQGEPGRRYPRAEDATKYAFA